MTVELLLAKQAITDVLHLYCRAMDRIDSELGKECFHAGAHDQHSSIFDGSGHEWIDWVNRMHSSMEYTRHSLSNCMIEVEGNDAWSESYWSLILRYKVSGDTVDLLAAGRYLDHFRNIDGKWAIWHRRTTNDWDRVEPVSGTALCYKGAPAFAVDTTLPTFWSKRDTTDLSYRFLPGHETDFRTT